MLGTRLPRCHSAVIQLKLHLSCQYFNYTLNNCFPIFEGVRIFRLIFLYAEEDRKLDIDTHNMHTHRHTMNACNNSALYL